MRLKNPYSKRFGRRVWYGSELEGNLHDFRPNPDAVAVLPKVAVALPHEGKKAGPLYVAHFWVGLNVGGEPRWNTEAVRDFVVKARGKQWQGQGASFGELQGAWAGPDRVEYEDSVQVMLINYPNPQKPEAFKRDMIELSKHLRLRFRQSEVWAIVEGEGKIVAAWKDVSRAAARAAGYSSEYEP